MCYCCTMCNKCGRFDDMRERFGKRECPKCKRLEPDNDVLVCPECGGMLPPLFPSPPEFEMSALDDVTA